MAYRGQIPLEDIRVDFQLEAVAGPDAARFGVKKTVTLHGPLSETQQRRLHRAAEYCPVGQLFTKGAMALEDQVTYSTGSAALAAASSAWARQPSANPHPPVPPGAVHARYLAETKEYADNGVLLHEGEVKVYLSCANLTRTGRWTLLAGHSSDGWVPPPVPLAYAALAASTVTTLQQCVSPDAWSVSGFHVEIAPYGGGSRDQAQASAAAGTINTRRAVRKVVLHSSPSAVLVQSIEAALQRDSLATCFRVGGVLLGEHMIAI